VVVSPNPPHPEDSADPLSRWHGAFRPGLRPASGTGPGLSGERHIIHGDLLNRNVLIADSQITAVIDGGNALYGDWLYALTEHETRLTQPCPLEATSMITEDSAPRAAENPP